MRLLIDSDFIPYAAGFAADTQWAEGKEPEGLEIVPLSFALYAAKNTLYNILDTVPHSTFDLYLSGGKNFRYDIAKTKPYKGNRDRSHKPTRFEEIRSYLIDTWGAVITDGIEADDIVCIEATANRDKVVICSMDKDLDQIPGKHFNPKRKTHYEIDDFQGQYNFYTQMLTGDVSDNIPGLPKVGPVAASKVLDGCKTPKDMYDSTLNAYLTRGFSSEYLQEQANLLYLWRKMPDKWSKPE